MSEAGHAQSCHGVHTPKFVDVAAYFGQAQQGRQLLLE